MHRKKKAPWPTLHFWIRLYDIKNLKHANVEVKDIVKFEFGTKAFNLYVPQSIFKDHCMRFYFSWISGAFNHLKEDPWRYCYNASTLYELVSIESTLKVAP